MGTRTATEIFDEAMETEIEEEEEREKQAQLPVVREKREMTPQWIGRVWRMFHEEVMFKMGRDVKERTFRALLPRLQMLHDLGIRTENAAHILAYEYGMHSDLKRRIEELQGKLGQGRPGGTVPRPPPGVQAYTVRRGSLERAPAAAVNGDHGDKGHDGKNR